MRRAKHFVHRNSQLHHAEVGAKMATGFCQFGDEFLAHFGGELFELVFRQFLDVRRLADHIQKSAHKLFIILAQRHGPRGEFAFQCFFQLRDARLGGL